MSTHDHRHLLILLLTITLLLAASAGPAGAGKLNLSLQKKLVESPQVSMTALVFLTPDVDNKISLSSSLSSIQSFKVRYKTAFSNLKSASRESYEAFIREAAQNDLGLEIGRRFWIANAVEVTGTPAGFARLAELESVQIIVEDTVLQLVDPVEVMESPTAPTAVEENLIAINADDLWQMGYTGEGRLVMSFDTGVDGGHDGLASRWRGLTSGNPSEGWYDPFSATFPGDAAGHGTHVMGLMAGHLNGDTVGVAPGVEWACAAVVDRGVGFSQTISNILLAFEWAANPDGDPETVHDIPDAVCHSWGIPRGVFDACDNTFWQAIDNLEQLGIVNVFACGNEGPDPMTIRNPADRASSPLNSFSVGAVDHTGDGYPVANFSSRGPANCDTTAIKPEVVAPGVSIRSFAPGGGMKLMSGTSMAAPQVAGAIALLRQYNPDATVEQIKHALLMSARDIGDEGEDNESGYGLIDLANALNYMPSPQQAQISIKRFDILDDGNGIIQPDETVQLAISIEPVGLDVDGLYGILSTYDPDVTILSDSVSYGDVYAGQEYSGTGLPFEMSASRHVTPGASVAFMIDFYDEYGSFLSSSSFDVVVAQSQHAASSSIDNGVTAIGGCNYGVVGLGEGSIVDMGQAGFSIDSVSYLSEFALVIADSDGRVSDAARDETGDASDNDFVADVAPSFAVRPPDSWGDIEMAGQFTDDLAEEPIGVGVDQRVTLFYEEDLSTTAFVRFSIQNNNQSGSRTLSLGVLADFDFPGSSKGAEMISYNSDQSLAFYYDVDLSCYVGTAILGDPVESWVYYSNSFDSKSGLSDSVKASAMNSGAISTQPSKRADYVHLMSIAPQTIDAGQVLEMAVAIVWAETESELIVKCDKAREAYLTPTAAGDDDNDPMRPESFTLSQNYPNPFNPQTTIQFSVERTEHVSMRVYNLLGQEVTTLIDQAVDAGEHEVVWNGTNHSGDRVASGIYFYRLDTSTGSITRKMMLLK